MLSISGKKKTTKISPAKTFLRTLCTFKRENTKDAGFVHESFRNETNQVI